MNLSVCLYIYRQIFSFQEDRRTDRFLNPITFLSWDFVLLIIGNYFRAIPHFGTILRYVRLLLAHRGKSAFFVYCYIKKRLKRIEYVTIFIKIKKCVLKNTIALDRLSFPNYNKLMSG